MYPRNLQEALQSCDTAKAAYLNAPMGSRESEERFRAYQSARDTVRQFQR